MQWLPGHRGQTKQIGLTLPFCWLKKSPDRGGSGWQNFKLYSPIPLHTECQASHESALQRTAGMWMGFPVNVQHPACGDSRVNLRCREPRMS